MEDPNSTVVQGRGQEGEHQQQTSSSHGKAADPAPIQQDQNRERRDSDGDLEERSNVLQNLTQSQAMPQSAFLAPSHLMEYPQTMPPSGFMPMLQQQQQQPTSDQFASMPPHQQSYVSSSSMPSSSVSINPTQLIPPQHLMGGSSAPMPSPAQMGAMNMYPPPGSQYSFSANPGAGGDDDNSDDSDSGRNRKRDGGTLVDVTESGEQRSGRRKINIEFIEDKSRRHITFSKRKAGIMKKAYELSTLTGTQVLLLVASETGHVYTFATPKLQPLITRAEGKNLIQACLNSPEGPLGSDSAPPPSSSSTMMASGQPSSGRFYDNSQQDDEQRERVSKKQKQDKAPPAPSYSPYPVVGAPPPDWSTNPALPASMSMMPQMAGFPGGASSMPPLSSLMPPGTSPSASALQQQQQIQQQQQQQAAPSPRFVALGMPGMPQSMQMPSGAGMATQVMPGQSAMAMTMAPQNYASLMPPPGFAQPSPSPYGWPPGTAVPTSAKPPGSYPQMTMTNVQGLSLQQLQQMQQLQQQMQNGGLPQMGMPK